MTKTPSVEAPGKVFLDTNFLIYLTDSRSPNHEEARKYFRFFRQHRAELMTSVICLAEFTLKADPRVVSQEIMILPLDMPTAIQAGHFAKIHNEINNDKKDRDCIAADIQLISQAFVEQCNLFITSDQRIGKICNYLEEKGSRLTFDVLDPIKVPVAIRYGILDLGM